MKKVLVIMAAVLILGGLAGGLTAAFAFNGGDESAPQIVHDVGVPPITPADGIYVGGTYELYFGSNPTTGYRWEVQFDEDILELVDRRFEIDSDLNPPAPGTGGTTAFVFKGLAPGSADVKFTYKRPWEDEVLMTEVININVRANPGKETMNLSEAMEIAQTSEVEAPSITVVTIEQSLEIAEQAVYNYVKGQDDLESLTLVETLTARCPSCWAFKFEAQTDKGLMNATVIVEQGEVERLDFGPKPYGP